jgi:hypothetical protein
MVRKEKGRKAETSFVILTKEESIAVKLEQQQQQEGTWANSRSRSRVLNQNAEKSLNNSSSRKVLRQTAGAAAGYLISMLRKA